MKRIMIMRHGKSDWHNNLRDFDRPLNKRGKRAAAFMGAELKKRDIVPDKIISSPAKRAEETTKHIVQNLGFNKEIEWNKAFYFDYTNEVISVLRGLDDNTNSVLIVGHNPTWSELVSYFTVEFIEMLTASIAVLEFDSKKWMELDKGSCKLKQFLKPKDLM